MARLEHVTCEYTGGGIYVYSALFNGEVWLYGGLDWYFGSYDIPGEQIEEDFDCDYDGHWKEPSVPYPTWAEILRSIRENCDESTAQDAERIITESNSSLRNRCIGNDDQPAPPPEDNTRRLETLDAFIEIFEDFLDERGIVIPNDEKDQDSGASNIYGTDYGELSDRIEELLLRLGYMN